ncbi:PLP-dependent aminotransferase family protein, partial [Roseomonas ludipueritiae]|nr:PLP-dependent aminotransferase family protein [Pseudoroseomonas ludipueritiae]
LVAATLAQAAGNRLRVTVPDQGLHLLATLPDGLPPGAAAEIRAAAGVEAWLLSETRMAPGGPDGFVLGYSGHAPAALKQAAERLGEAVRTHAPAGTMARSLK